MSDKLFSVKDQVVLITGGSRGIGKELASAFVDRNAHVIIAGRNKKTLEETATEISTVSNSAYAEICDVSKIEDVNALIKSVMTQHGRIDTLVSVAGINKRMKAESYTTDEYDYITDINAKGAWIIAQAVGKKMITQGSGSIINVDSLNTYAPLRGTTPYAMSKASVLMMTRGLANEWGRHDIRVNSIAPGFILTDLTKKVWSDETMQAWGRTNTPLKRLGKVSDLVGAAIFLASDASQFMTGQTLRVDGGFTAGINWPIEL
ncbi:glucose 1-dehydrogenase [Burkholderiales bacterium]|nr:glucose 1-dehydrogenase [Burkholderiales bacterium]